MATSIHHGPPGSYKSFSIVQRFAIPALEQGRVVVSNIRAFSSLQAIIDAFPEKTFSPDSKIIFVDTTTHNGRLHMACWFQWVPFGALILIDEAQRIYPDRRDFKLESLGGYKTSSDPDALANALYRE